MYEVPLALSLLCFRMGTMLSNFKKLVVLCMLVLRAVSACSSECESKRASVFYVPDV